MFVPNITIKNVTLHKNEDFGGTLLALTSLLGKKRSKSVQFQRGMSRDVEYTRVLAMCQPHTGPRNVF
jgi:hypothetical protein